jgi:gas vesicle protein
MFERKNKFTGFILTFGAGILTGAALALLYTPLTGKNMQKKVADITDKVIEKVDDLQSFVRRANA